MSTSPGRCGGRASTGCRAGRGSPWRSRAPAGPAEAVAAALGCVGAGTLLRAPPLGLLAAALVVAGAAAGAVRIAHIERVATAPAPGMAVAGRATLLERPRPSRFGWSAAA